MHRELAAHRTETALIDWRTTLLANIERLRADVHGQPHIDILARWQHIIEHDDVSGIRHVLTGLDRPVIEMRDVTPMGGLLSNDIRRRRR